MPLDGYLKHRGSFYRAPEALVHQRVELRFDRDRVWITHQGNTVASYERSYRPGIWQPAPRMRPEPPPPIERTPIEAPRITPPELADYARPLRMSAASETQGERLPFLIGKLKAPRIAERLTETAASAREGKWSYEQFLETLLEAEVFARDASGTRNRIRHAAFPAHKTLEDFGLHRSAGGGATASDAPRPARLGL